MFEQQKSFNVEWDKLTDTEKIERMRDIVKGLERTIGYLQTQNQQMFNDFYSHSHSGERVLVAPNRNQGLTGLGVNTAKLANPNYF